MRGCAGWPRECTARPFVTTILDMNRCFMPEALAGVTSMQALGGLDRRRLNQIRACSYLHLFDVFEASIAKAASVRSHDDPSLAAMLEPLFGKDCFDHHDLFFSFETLLSESFPVLPRLVTPPPDFAMTFASVDPQSLLVLALHLKLVTQQHYLACVRGDESLEPNFVRLLKDHWGVECGKSRSDGAVAIQRALADVARGHIQEPLVDYRLLVFACDDLLRQQAELDVETLEDARGHVFDPVERRPIVAAQVAAHRKTFLTVGIVNASFVYALRALGPMAPAILAGVVSALGSR